MTTIDSSTATATGTATGPAAPATGTAYLTTVRTPIGPFTVVAVDGASSAGTEAPVVLASGWTDDPAALLPQVAAPLRPATLHPTDPDSGPLRHLAETVRRFHDGDLTAIDAVAVHQQSAPFRSHAWEVLRTVRPGRPVTYTEYAALTGRASAVRAAAGACAFNAAALFVPCHRVIRSDGSLGGFRWGLDVKRWLLDHEANAA